MAITFKYYEGVQLKIKTTYLMIGGLGSNSVDFKAY